ncbi:hypothetical protein V6N13_082254 [Hibiscus sabdariffa]|uniref:Uncharacterized protein n=1 Tax=Hibiscus sabdariffa TaxID=183260 RepID=A0ABR2Q2W2_9ROSI
MSRRQPVIKQAYVSARETECSDLGDCSHGVRRRTRTVCHQMIGLWSNLMSDSCSKYVNQTTSAATLARLRCDTRPLKADRATRARFLRHWPTELLPSL